MFLLVIVCLMKLVNITTMNRCRKYCGRFNDSDSKENRALNGQQLFAPPPQKHPSLDEYYDQRKIKLIQQRQQQRHVQYEKLRFHCQQQREQDIKKTIESRQQQQQQQEQKQKIPQCQEQQIKNQTVIFRLHPNQNEQQRNFLMRQQIFKRQQLQKQNYFNFLYSKLVEPCYCNGKGGGNEPLRGMTEYPTNEKQKSHQTQLNHPNSTHPHHQHHHPNNSGNFHHQTINQKRQLTTSPNLPPFNYGIPNYNNQSHHPSPFYGYQFNTNEKIYDGLYDDELTEENLKKNVQIVLNNLDRYNNALRSIILNDHQTTSKSISSSSSSYNINNLSYNNNTTRSILDSFCSFSATPSVSITQAAMANILSSPESDYNSNATPHHNNFMSSHLNCSIASSHDFTHDNSDYQWFLDYGYRDGGGFTHQSVLSSLSASYNGIGEISYYEDLAKNIDANLAEVDMESFCAQDIHSLLSHIPTMCNKDRQQSMNGTQDEQNDICIDNSICKSELLFSPVKESHISIDSLDLESYPDDGDIILTCKANKDNYTIAFEGSTLYSDESYYAEPIDPNATKNKQNFINLYSNLDDIVKRKSLEVSMSRSDHAFTTWSKLKKGSSSQLQRYPSGNNNTSVNNVNRHAPNCIVRKSSSLPNLRLRNKSLERQQLNVSQAVSNSTVESFKSRNLLPMCQMPISTSTGSCESPAHSSSNMNSTDENSLTSFKKQQQTNQPAFNLVKLFIKQKSNSSDTCMDVSSGCWPSSDASSSLEQLKSRKKSMNDSGKGSGLSRQDEEENNDDVVVEDVDDCSYQLDSLDCCDQQSSGNGNRKSNSDDTLTNATTITTPRKIRNDLYREVFEQQQQRNSIKEFDNMNAHHHQPLKNPQVLNLTVQNNLNNNNLNNNNHINNNNNNSIERDSLSRDLTHKSTSDFSRTSENLTQVFCNSSSNNRLQMPTVETITRSMQTSNLMRDKLRFVPPSFLAKLNKLGEEKRAPVYVIYPNYALPDLGFVKTNTNLSEVILSPFNYKNAVSLKKRRPKSFTGEEEEALKHIDRRNIVDWESLVTLLPIEYRKKLSHIPEADIELDPDCLKRPLFCMSPPIRKNIKSTVCDCATYFQQQHQPCTTSSSGSSQPPSSGYRGSSTLLTDSEVDITLRNDNSSGEQLKSTAHIYNYHHQYTDSNRMEPDIVDRPPPSGRQPRGILRRNHLKNMPKSKRNSMFEEHDLTRIKNSDKRRSLQEPYYMSEGQNIVEDYLAELEEDKDRLQQQQYYTDYLQSNKMRKEEHDIEARIRAETFLSSVPKSELKYYAEIANILESTDDLSTPEYDSIKLKTEVSRALSQKKVSFTHGGQAYYNNGGLLQKFSTPPNSPNISIAGYRSANHYHQHHHHNNRLHHENNRRKELTLAEKEKLDKISSNRFKRLQIQWELLSKDSSLMLKDLAREKETKSGGSTPTSANTPGSLAQKSRIPRPVSYPASKTTHEQQNGKTIRSPSRIVPPKKYSVPSTTITTNQSNSTATTQPTRPRTPNRLNTTPKKRVPSPRSGTRVR